MEAQKKRIVLFDVDGTLAKPMGVRPPSILAAFDARRVQKARFERLASTPT
jgi:phosphoglycolate phosphatase-like HAD superfamily hydrolase